MLPTATLLRRSGIFAISSITPLPPIAFAPLPLWLFLRMALKRHRRQAVAFAASIGSVKATRSVLSDKEAPVPAVLTAVKGMVAVESLDSAVADAGTKSVATGDDKVPHATDPIVAISARAGLVVVAGQDVAMLAGENVAIGAGQDIQVASGGAARIHSGQAIGVLGGAIGPGAEAAGKGLTLIAGQGDVELQAQADRMQVAAKGDVQVQSKSAHVDWAAAKKITLATAGGASIVIEGGNITVMCPGKITVRAGMKSFLGAETAGFVMPTLPAFACESCLLNAAAMASPFAAKT